jgi:ABC-type polysaccharide/polyol phosphate transport system ATPase subunit
MARKGTHQLNMDGETLIQIEGVGKKYCRSLKRSVWYGVQDIAREIAGLAIPTDRLRADEFWALRDLSLEVRRGECLGIVGPNGAGKSTLLKLISGIFMPDIGTVRVRGRVGALIEVGAGFHPMLTGRENIYINGAVLGMPRREIDRKFDEIVAFSGLEEFLDMPVKHYSSGMYVRLGFAVAAHVEPDILLIDEVLAVGDMAFTAKCLRHVSALKERCAVLLVSHDMRNITRMSDNVLYLRGQRTALLASPDEAIQRLREDMLTRPASEAKQGHESLEIVDVRLDRPLAVYRQFEDIAIGIHLDVKADGLAPVLNVAVHRSDGVHCFGILSKPMKQDLKPGQHIVVLKLLQVALMPGQHEISVFVLDEDQTGLIAFHERALSFMVVGDERTRGVYTPAHQWMLEKTEDVRRDLRLG